MKKVCVRCGKKITKFEDYIETVEYFGGEANRRTYYHRDCLSKDRKKKEFMTAAVAGMLGRANKLMGRLE